MEDEEMVKVGIHLGKIISVGRLSIGEGWRSLGI